MFAMFAVHGRSTLVYVSASAPIMSNYIVHGGLKFGIPIKMAGYN